MEYLITSHSKSKLGYHIVFCPKFRKPVLVEGVAVELKHIIGQTCLTYGWKLHSLEIMPDHVHMFIQLSPSDTLTNVVRTIKSTSAVYLFSLFPKLKGQKFWGSGLWSSGTYYATVGSVSEEAVKMYIENQKSRD